MSISTTAPAAVPSIATPALATATVTAPATTPRRTPRYPHIPAKAGNANVRALLGQGIHPASGQPLTTTATPDRGRDRDASRVREYLKCSKAPVSRRGRQGIDLRPDLPACTLHCSFTDWPFDPDGHDQTLADQIGTGRDHADDWGVYTVYRIFGIDEEYQRAWVAVEAEMTPNAAAPTGHAARPPRYSRPDQPQLYRFWTRLSRLHTAHITHPTDVDTSDCTHLLVRSGRVLLGQPGA
ncbi:hypothetical protein OG413_41425 [Streptomyces sp. NBC_01433]|uniref:hypothetical protein n=1 Tax=Streptomyces sp. NBC_01433 TaxID=2903864 RepID=UPI00224D3AA9|nr:hypothetical protein [Streptomyces sp. NBC_01433]MCX4681665.1 hypothetical protein [Streptomyces sp. NBC_01433]